MKNLWAAIGILSLLLLVAGAAYVGAGLYDVAADVPHWAPTFRVLEIARDRSIDRKSRDVQVPAGLQDEHRVLKGAGQYAAMCAGCHLAPGGEPSELARGLYPAPPDLSKNRVDARTAFTVIKHGIKMTAMPAWGGHHGDEQIWNMVAFLARLPDLTPPQYAAMIASPEADMASEMAAHHETMSAAEPHSDSDHAMHMHTPGASGR